MATLLTELFKRMFGRRETELKTEKADPFRQETHSTEEIPVPIHTKLPDCGNNHAFLLLLSKFGFANSLENLGDKDTWRKGLKTEPALAVERLIAEGFLQPADLVSVLPSAFGSAQLKSMAKERGLPTSGTKDVLARRLASADHEGVTKLVDLSKFFMCSETGREAVQKFEAAENERKRNVESECLDALRNGQFRDACLKVAAFEATKVFKRGVGIDWDSNNRSEDLAVLKFLFTRSPKRLAGLSDETLLRLRVAAGMTYLWGVNDPSPWLSAVALDEVGLDADVGAMVLLSNAQHQHRIETMKAAGIKKVEVLGGGLEACVECTRQEGKVYDINKVPDIPFDNCTCENGCLCLVTAKL